MRIKLTLAVLGAVLVLGGVNINSPVKYAPQPVLASASDKEDEDCTGLETEGRCADKCPVGYFMRGGCVRVTGCPYGDSIPLGPECDKHAPQEIPQDTEGK